MDRLNQRSIVLLANATKSEHTFKTYMYNLKLFKDFYKIKDYDSLLTIKTDKINQMIEDYIIHLKKAVSPNSIPTMYYGIELFFAMNDVIINTKKIRRLFPAKRKRTGFKPYTTLNIQNMLKATRKKRDRAFIHFLSSTGARIGAIEDLKVKHVKQMLDPEFGDCKKVLMYEGTEEEYTGFLTPEATKALDEYLEERTDDGERINPDSPLFRTIYARGLIRPKPITKQGAKNIIYRAITEAKIERTKLGFAYDIQMDHGFRKRSNTILKLNNEVNSNVAEKLMAHKRGLDGVYLKPTDEECFKEFKKAILELTIDDAIRLEYQNRLKDKKIKDLEEDKDKRITNLEQMMEELAKRLDAKS